MSNVAPTLAGLLATAEARLEAAHLAYGHGTTNAHDEAAWLLLWQLGLPLDADLSELAQRPVSAEEQAAVLALVEKRISTRKPAAYLTREAWLQGVSFYVDERTIVPRSLIAELIANGGFDEWLGDHTQRVLDLCTGNASLAVLSALAWPEVQVTGADICPNALAVAKINVERHRMQDRITLQQSDGLADVPGTWDLIICNPPYVNATSMAALPPEYRAEPVLALAGGSDGMDFIRQLLRDAPAHMSEHAVLVLEIGNEREFFEARFAQLPVFWLNTSAGEDQVLLITRDALSRFDFS